MIFGIVSFAWSGLGSSFGPAVILSLWWKKTTREGIIAGLLTGSIVTMIWGSSVFLKSIVTERRIIVRLPEDFAWICDLICGLNEW